MRHPKDGSKNLSMKSWSELDLVLNNPYNVRDSIASNMLEFSPTTSKYLGNYEPLRATCEIGDDNVNVRLRL